MRLSKKHVLVLAVLGIVALTAAFVLEGHRRQGLYWYDVQQDYEYDFNADGSTTLTVTLGEDGVTLPHWQGGGNTAVLKLRVASSLSGRWFDPCVDIDTDSGPDRQCFDRGGAGLRYLLLPPGVVEPGRHIAMTGHHLTWDEQAAELILFQAPDLSGMRVLVLAPHPDDAEIAAFGLYSRHDSFIVTMTAGNYVDGLYSGLSLDESTQNTLRGEVRSWDSLAVPLWGGVPSERLVSLGYVTHSLREYYLAEQTGSTIPAQFGAVPEVYRLGALSALLEGRQASPDWNSVVADLVAVLRSVQPDVVVTPHPALDSAADHQYTTVALLEALERVGDDHAVLLLYNNHHVLAEHYPFGPSNARITLPPWFGEGQFPGMLSYELDDELQLRKLFALEAMHDLRPAPLRLTGGPTRVLFDRLKQAYELVRRDPFGDYSYFRRAVRPNELFFVYYPADRKYLLGQPRDVHCAGLPMDCQGIR